MSLSLQNKSSNFSQFKNLGIAALLATGLVFAAGHHYVQSNPEKVTASLVEEGYSDIQVKDKYSGCFKGETGERNFEAKDPQGNLVEGHICQSVLAKRIVTIRKASEDQGNTNSYKLGK